MNLEWIFALQFAIGMLVGLRSMTPLAAICWAASLKWINITDSHLAFLGSTPAVYLFSAFAAGELILDKMPFMHRRTRLAPLTARILLAALCGIALAMATNDFDVAGALLGAGGGVAGAYGGYHLRRRIVNRFKFPDWLVALLEDGIAVGGSFWILSHLNIG